MYRQEKGGYSLSFAAWELRLYLDTHPNDARALEAYRQLCSRSGSGCSYACSPGQGNNAEEASPEVWTWIADPWPWEAAANRLEEA